MFSLLRHNGRYYFLPVTDTNTTVDVKAIAPMYTLIESVTLMESIFTNNSDGA